MFNGKIEYCLTDYCYLNRVVGFRTGTKIMCNRDGTSIAKLQPTCIGTSFWNKNKCFINHTGSLNRTLLGFVFFETRECFYCFQMLMKFLSKDWLPF